MSPFEVFEYKFMCYPVFEEPRNDFPIQADRGKDVDFFDFLQVQK